MPENIRIKYFDTPEFKMPRLHHIDVGDWIDLYAKEDTFIPAISEYDKPEFTLSGYKHVTFIPLGIAMELPKDYEAYILPRSSTFKRWGIIQVNSQAVIDNSYCGDNDMWRYAVTCLYPNDTNTIKIDKNHTITIKGTWIHAGDRICQFRIQKRMPEIHFEEVKHLPNKDRGGIGSTGAN